jgi:hypothetical protein
MTCYCRCQEPCSERAIRAKPEVYKFNALVIKYGFSPDRMNKYAEQGHSRPREVLGDYRGSGFILYMRNPLHI